MHIREQFCASIDAQKLIASLKPISLHHDAAMAHHSFKRRLRRLASAFANGQTNALSHTQRIQPVRR